MLSELNRDCIGITTGNTDVFSLSIKNSRCCWMFLIDSKTRLWNFAVKDYELLMDKVMPLRPEISLGPLPSYVLRIVRESSVSADSIDLAAIDPTLRNKLMPFQEAGVRFGIAKGGRCMIADDMGLGKTFQALAIASYYQADWPLLIVTTSSMRETWREQIASLLPGVPLASVVVVGGSRDLSLAADACVLIASHKTSALLATLHARRPGVVIIDESHYLKSQKAQCTKAMTAITKKARRVILLSGTPALSRPAELYSQLSIIEPKLFPSFTEYGKRYCNGKMGPFGWDMSGQSNLVELQVLLQRRFLIRRTKEQVLPSMQEKVRESVLLDPASLEMTSAEQHEMSSMAQNLTRLSSAEKHAALLTFFSESARVKIPAVCEYLRRVVGTETCKVLVFAHHACVLDAACATLDDLRVPHVRISGSTRADRRAPLVERFQTSDACRAAVLSITAAGAGITLTAAQLVLFAELHWNPGILSQAESRAHRIGQRGRVCVRYLLARGTSDDFMWPMLRHKLNVLNEVGLSEDNFDNTTCIVQENPNSIMKYLNSPSATKNKNDYIPGTNIRISQEAALSSIRKESSENRDHGSEGDETDKSFWEDDEGDDLLAKLDLKVW